MRLYVVFAAIVLTCSGCFSRFVMTERQIRTYYRNKPVKPTYFTIQNDSVRLFCATTGADTLPPLVVIHGAPGAWYGGRVFLDDSTLRQHYHIITMDRLGYHRSRFKRRPKAVPSIELQAIAIHECLRLNRSFKPGVVLGSSYGAAIAAKMVLLYPGQFNRLIMLAAAIDPDKEKFWWFSPYVRYAPARWFLPRFINHATDEKFAHVAELRKMLPEWQKLSVPITVVQGGADDIIDPANLDFAKKQLQGKQAEFIFLPNAGHLIRLQAPALVKSILLKQPAGTNGY